ESPNVMVVPMAILALGAVALGLILGPTGVFNHFLEKHWMQDAFPHLLPFVEHHHNLILMIASGLLALAGIGLAWWMYVLKPATAKEWAQALPGAYGLSRNRFYLDEIYDALIVRPVAGFAQVLRVIDLYVVDGLVDLTAQVPRWLGM